MLLLTFAVSQQAAIPVNVSAAQLHKTSALYLAREHKVCAAALPSLPPHRLRKQPSGKVAGAQFGGRNKEMRRGHKKEEQRSQDNGSPSCLPT